MNDPKAPYLENLNPEQLAAVHHSGSNLLVHAGAGSGKTRVVVARILHHILEQKIPPWHILAVTFTNRAMREMRERLETRLGVCEVLIRTFHSFGAWLLRRHTEEAGLSRGFSIYDEEDSQALLKQALPGIGKDARPLQHAISRAKDQGLGYTEEISEEALAPYSAHPDFCAAFAQYQKALRESQNADFADLLGLSVQLLQNHPKVRENIQQRFERILVDEYQDSNPLQNRLLQLLLHPAAQKPRTQELCIVGDEDQSIYGFRGAEIDHILDFQKNFAPAHIVKLEQNYRSCAPILELANCVISQNQNRLGKKLRPNRSGGERPEFHHFENHEDEAVFIAQCILRTPKVRSAVLYRTNAQSRIFERIFREWRIPYHLVGNTSFYRREEIKDVLAYLKCLANPRDLVSFARIYNKPRRGLGTRIFEGVQAILQAADTNTPSSIIEAMQQLIETRAFSARSLNKLQHFAEQFCALHSLLGSETEPGTLLLGELLQRVLEHSGLLAHYQQRDEQEGSERCANFDNLLEEAQHYGSGLAALAAFLESIELETEELDKPDAERYLVEQQTLITMHNTKGLEFERVFITGLEFGIFPKREAFLSDTRQMEEERRLFYVAITRAERELYLSAAKSRFMYGRNEYHKISPLLLEIDRDLYVDCRAGHEPARKAAKAQKSMPAKTPWKSLSSSALGDFDLGTKEKSRQRASDPFVVGARVEHLDFGLGYVVQRKFSGEITTLMIRLDDGRLIRVQLEFQKAKLDFLGDTQRLGRTQTTGN